jgi:coenzyme Q-binding protein COQ10
MRMRISLGCGPPARRNWPADSVTIHRLELVLPYRPEDLFDLVADVDRYPDFIQWIQSLKIHSEQEDEKGVRCRAEVIVGFKAFRETFVTDVEARRSDLTVEVSLVRGPFKKLSNQWRFVPTSSGTKVEFFIAFEFRNLVLQALADANKGYAIRRLIDAFVAEAERRYQKARPSVGP